jgi:hypothetical protein
MNGEKQSLFGEIVHRLGEIRLTHEGKQLSGSQTLNELDIPDGAMLHKHGRLRGGADVEDRSQKHKQLLWIAMETPEGEQADYSMSEKNIKRSGTVHYECSMRRAKDRAHCTAKVVHYYDQAEPTIVRDRHNHPPPNRPAKAAINRAKEEAVRYRDHRVSAIVDRAHGELEGAMAGRVLANCMCCALQKMTSQRCQLIGALPRISATPGRSNRPKQSTGRLYTGLLLRTWELWPRRIEGENS